MADRLPHDEDARLRAMFREAARPVADDGFSEAVIGRIARRAWRRRILLAAAGISGFAVAFQPLWSAAELLGRGVTAVGSRWPELTAVLDSQWVLAAGLLVLALPPALRWLEE